VLFSLLNDPVRLVVELLAIVVAITIHEFSHAWAADYLGDPTPRLQGRLNLDPRSHIDPIGFILILLFGFGWGKPVTFDPYNLNNIRRDAALISIAGPASNIVFAIVLSILFRLAILIDHSFYSTIGGFILYSWISMNVTLAIFNLIPIHPLDGFKIVGGILSEKQARSWYDLERYGMIFLLILLFVPIGGRSLLNAVIAPPINFILSLLLPALSSTGIL
jgi:Zn-dependent protease